MQPGILFITLDKNINMICGLLIAAPLYCVNIMGLFVFCFVCLLSQGIKIQVNQTSIFLGKLF